MPEPALRASGLSRHYHGVAAVADFSLEVAVGEFCAVLGPSGSGKTTALRLIAGFERPDGGSLELFGAPVAGGGTFVPPERRDVGMVFQDYALFPHMNVAENVRVRPARRLAQRARAAAAGARGARADRARGPRRAQRARALGRRAAAGGALARARARAAAAAAGRAVLEPRRGAAPAAAAGGAGDRAARGGDGDPGHARAGGGAVARGSHRVHVGGARRAERDARADLPRAGDAAGRGEHRRRDGAARGGDRRARAHGLRGAPRAGRGGARAPS